MAVGTGAETPLTGETAGGAGVAGAVGEGRFQLPSPAIALLPQGE